MPLPTTKTPPKRSLSDVSILLYGPSKIGKSTFASQAPDAIFLATEPGLNALEVYQHPITSWPEFLEVCAELARPWLRNRSFSRSPYTQCRDTLCEDHQIFPT
jgi:RecA-family ATPase